LVIATLPGTILVPDPRASNTVMVTWTPAALSTPAVATWVVQYSTNGFAGSNVFQVTDSQPALTPNFEVTGLSASTTYRFRVAGRSSSGALSTWTTSNDVTTAATASPALCQLGTATITPGAIKRKNSSSTVLTQDAAVSVNTNASTTCTGLRLVFSPTAAVSTTVYLVQTSGGLWTATVDGQSTSWDTGTHLITIRDNTTPSLGSLTLTACVHNAVICP